MTTKNPKRHNQEWFGNPIDDVALTMGTGGGVGLAFPAVTFPASCALSLVAEGSAPTTDGSAAPRGSSGGAMLNGNFHGANQIEKATH
ncbi:MAG TPA: hypothetical protein VGO51_11230 [Burkholderiaceae bacterium]|nr:hypothetical protein [Burkholderiaceae bacterium]